MVELRRQELRGCAARRQFKNARMLSVACTCLPVISCPNDEYYTFKDTAKHLRIHAINLQPYTRAI